MNASAAAHPAAYLRRSYVDPNSPGDISRDAQREAVTRLAKADGHNGDLVTYDDWGVSADVAKAAKRMAYTRLLADMEAGAVSSVYAFDVDRLYRDPRDLIRLQDAAQRHRVRIVTTGGPLAIGDGDDPAAEGFAFMGAVFGRMELQKIKKRNRAARDARLARGDALGRAAYGYKQVRDAEGRIVHVPDPAQPLEPVVAAFREAGSFQGAAKLLNARNMKSPRGGSWAGNVVARIIRRDAPGLLAGRRVEARVRVKGSFTLARLLRCSCGQVMTGRRTQHRTKYGDYEYTSYLCFRGRSDMAHPRPYIVSERALLPWVVAEVARLRPPADRVEIREADSGRLDELEARRGRVLDNYEDGLIDKAARDRKLAAITSEAESLEVRAVIESWPEPIDWNWPPEALNEALTVILDSIQLDETMRPVSARWRVPELRS